MASNSSFPDPDQNQADDKTNSATVILVTIPQPELVALTENMSESEYETARNEYNNLNYLYSVKMPDSAFVNAKSTSDDDSGAISPFMGGFPSHGFGGNGRGGDGDVHPDNVADTFQLEHIGGLDDQKEYLRRSIILPLVKPNVLKDWGVSPPKGILLHGPPGTVSILYAKYLFFYKFYRSCLIFENKGTGKTFMAKAIVNELKKQLGTHVNFYYRKGGDVFSMWFGDSQRKLRQVFEAARLNAPSVIFFDEIDGLCPSREQTHQHGTQAYATIVTCFLGQMDMVENGKVFVIAATNRLDSVDPAVRRPGRFDKYLSFGVPEEMARQKIIQIHTSKWSKCDQPNQALVAELAKRTQGFSGADLEKLCKDVVYHAISTNGDEINDNLKITANHWQNAIDGIQRTAVNNFGSFLYIPTKPCEMVSKLVEPTVNAIIKKISLMLSTQSLSLDPSQFTELHRSFLLHITNQQQQSKSFMNNQIIQALLTNPLFNKMSFFELSAVTVTNRVLSGSTTTILSVIRDIISQMQDAQQGDNCAVLIIPSINELLEIAKVNNVPFKVILHELKKIRGPKMFLVATSSIPMKDLQEGIAELFFGCHMLLSNPRDLDDNLKQFYKYVLEPTTRIYPRKTRFFNKIAETAARISDNNEFEHVLNLASALREVNVEPKEGEDTETVLNKEFESVFNRYRATKLR